MKAGNMNQDKPESTRYLAGRASPTWWANTNRPCRPKGTTIPTNEGLSLVAR